MSIERLSKAYGAHRAVDQVSIEVVAGEFVTLLGPSGCGKTTVLRMIGGFIRPDSGTIALGGAVIDDLPPNRRQCGFVFQSYALFPHMTVAENIGYGPRIRGTPRHILRRRVEELIDIVNLDGLEHRYPRQLSGGQQQRVAVARALAIEPKALLLDEPLSNLDAKLRERIRFELRVLQKRTGVTTVFVTHDQEEAMAVSDRIVVMRQGRIEQVGTPTDIYNSPRTPFVADFVGQNNFVNAKVENRAGGTLDLVLGAARLSVRGNAAIGQSVIVAIRPQMIALHQREPREQPNRLAGTISLAVFLGTSTRYEVALVQGPTLKVLVNIPGPLLPVGQQIWVTWRPEDAYVLPAEAGAEGAAESDMAAAGETGRRP